MSAFYALLVFWLSMFGQPGEVSLACSVGEQVTISPTTSMRIDNLFVWATNDDQLYVALDCDLIASVTPTEVSGETTMAYDLLSFLLNSFGQHTNTFMLGQVKVDNVNQYARFDAVAVWSWSNAIPYHDNAVCAATAPTGITCIFPNGLVVTDIDI